MAKVLAVMVKLRQAVRKTPQLVDLVCARLEQCDDWKRNNHRKVTFTLDSGTAVSAAPKSFGDDYPIQIDGPRSYNTATGEPVQDEGSLTGEG